MRAVGIEQFGDTPRLMDLPAPEPRPEPEPGYLRVAVEAAGVNPLDRVIASGAMAGFGEYRMPLTLGMDGAGTVTAVGEGVSGFGVGDRVFGQFWSQPLQFGTFAEVCVVQAEPAFGALAKVPAGLSASEAAALPTAGMTAVGMLERAGAGEKDTVLMLGAAGGVGTFAVQLAAQLGLRVIAPAAARVAEELRELGVTEVVGRDPETLDGALRELAPDGVAAVFDFVGDRTLLGTVAKAVRDGGAVLSAAFGVDEALLADPRVHAANYRLDRKSERLAEIGRLAAAGAVRAVIGTRLQLAEVPRALGTGVEAAGLRGKTVVEIARVS